MFPTATAVPTIKPPEDADAKASLPANAPLAPPPKPSQNGNGEGDFFGAQSAAHLSKEPNPFENAFGNPVETPGKTQLPGVTSLTSPASLLPGNTPGWPGSLRSGPLSPAMLTGPTGSNDYFNSDHHFAGSFPTPNESSLRSGLTPGGGGSMFPQPSPNSQALYNQLQNGGATPGTLDFHRTAMNARAQNQVNSYNNNLQGTTTSQPQQNPNIQPDLDSKPYNPNNSQSQHDNQDPFGSHQTNDAANGLFMLAQAGGQQRNSQYPMQQQPQQSYQQQQQQNAQDTRGKGSIGSTMSGSTDGGDGQYSDDGDHKPNTRNGRGKKGSTGGGKAAANGKRKTEETPAKGPASKKQRASLAMSEEPDDEDDGMDGMDGMDGDRKMTDEEKRKNFLERNRYVVLQCCNG
jgi:ATF/CREB family transcription factor